MIEHDNFLCISFICEPFFCTDGGSNEDLT